MKIEISDLESDIINEMVNIGLAKAADSFAAIAKDTVYMNVPSVRIINSEEAGNILEEFEGTQYIVESEIVGELSGKTLILFINAHIEKISEVCIGSRERFKGNYDKMQISLLLEVSNILTGALVTQLANLLHLEIYGSLPTFINSEKDGTLLQAINSNSNYQPFIFLVKTQFINSGKWVEMPLMLAFDFASVQKILEIIRNKQHGDKNMLTR